MTRTNKLIWALVLGFWMATQAGVAHTAEPADSSDTHILLQEDHELPVVYVAFHWAVGSERAAADTAALLRCLGSTWSKAGLRDGPGADLLQSQWDSLGVTVRSWSGQWTSGISFWIPARSLAPTLPLMKRLVLEPVVEETAVRAVRERQEASILDRQTDPSSVVEEKILALLGDDPMPSAEVIDVVHSVDAQALQSLHRNVLKTTSMWVGAVGDFDASSFRDVFRDLLSNATGLKSPTSQRATSEVQPGVYVLNQDSDQVTIQWGRRIPVTRWSTDFADHILLSNVLGFGRVFYAIRSKGLGFDGTAYLNAGDNGAYLMASGTCRLALAQDYLSVLRHELHGRSISPILQSELESARLACLGAMLNLPTKRDILDRRLLFAAGADDSTAFSRYVEGIRKATLQHINSHLGSYDLDSTSVLLVAGPADSLRAICEDLKLGPVITLRDVKADH